MNGDSHGGGGVGGGVGSVYSGELVIFDRHGSCSLSAGRYELVLELQSDGDSTQLCKSSPKKNSSWESIDNLKIDGMFNNNSVLKFVLNWNESSNSSSERPRLRPLKPLDVVLANSASTKPKPQGKNIITGLVYSWIWLYCTFQRYTCCIWRKGQIGGTES